MTGGYIAVRHLSGDGCAHHCHKNFGGCSPMTCGIPSGHHWKRVAPPPEPRRNTDPKPTTYAEWEDLEEERDQLRAHRDRLAAELATSGPSCDRCQSSHCCSVAGHTPPLCVTDPEGSLPLWMPWTNEDVRKRMDAVYAQVDRLQAELARVRKAATLILAEAEDVVLGHPPVDSAGPTP